MSDTPNRPPLWRQMTDAYCDATDSVVRDMETIAIGTAAEIRAVRDWIEKRQAEDYAVTLPDVCEVIGWLTAEADRAEKGEVQHG